MEDVNEIMENVAEAEATEATEKKDERVWTLDDGTECSKSAFVRERFTKHNMTRKDISDQYEIPYRTVYGATLNMENEAEPATKGRAAAQHKIKVDEEGRVLKIENGKYFLGDVEIEASDFELIKDNLKEIDRNDFIREQMEAGKSRGALAEMLGVSYGVVYAATKDLGGARKQHMVEYEGKEISRNEYIKIKFEQGMSKADIAKELDVDYAVVWNATKKEKTEQEKYEEAIEKVEKFEPKVPSDVKEEFTGAVEILKAVSLDDTTEEAKENTEA